MDTEDEYVIDYTGDAQSLVNLTGQILTDASYKSVKGRNVILVTKEDEGFVTVPHKHLKGHKITVYPPKDGCVNNGFFIYGEYRDGKIENIRHIELSGIEDPEGLTIETGDKMHDIYNRGGRFEYFSTLPPKLTSANKSIENDFRTYMEKNNLL